MKHVVNIIYKISGWSMHHIYSSTASEDQWTSPNINNHCSEDFKDRISYSDFITWLWWLHVWYHLYGDKLLTFLGDNCFLFYIDVLSADLHRREWKYPCKYNEYWSATPRLLHPEYSRLVHSMEHCLTWNTSVIYFNFYSQPTWTGTNCTHFVIWQTSENICFFQLWWLTELRNTQHSKHHK
jgi:hypothetical protein